MYSILPTKPSSENVGNWSMPYYIKHESFMFAEKIGATVWQLGL
jgi:hypothetical protein